MAVWPVQTKCAEYYGTPKSAALARDLVTIRCPWALTFEGKAVAGITIHKKCAPSLQRILQAIWDRLGRSQAEIDRIGMSKFSGSYNPRKIAGTNRWSPHAYGCAVDFDSANNWLGDTTPAMDRRVIEEFEREGWEWGGHWTRPDGMHFQAAWTRANPPRLGALTVQPKVTTKQLAQVSEKVSFLAQVRNWLTAAGGVVGGVFGADNLGLFQGWFSVFAGLGKYVLAVGVFILLGLFVYSVLMTAIKKDYEEGRWTPSGEAPAPEVTELQDVGPTEPSQ